MISKIFSQLEHAQQLATKPTALDKLAATVDFEFFRDSLLDSLAYRERVDKREAMLPLTQSSC